MSITTKQHNSINGTATTNESSADVNVKTIVVIANDSDSGDLYFSVANPISEDSDYFVIKAGESFRNLQLATKKIYFKSSTGSVPFRFVGTKA